MYFAGGEVASADGMRFVTSGRTIHSGANRKYSGSGRGITWYNFLSDQYVGFHGIVVPGTLRDSIFVLEGLLEQQTGLTPREIMTDTAGANDMIFRLFWMLGYQSSPRLADAGEATLWRIDNEDYRRRILTQLNRGESRHALARAICYRKRSEFQQSYRDGQEDQFGALGLAINAVVLWNTIYMDAAINRLREQGEEINEADLARLPPLLNKHINMLGHYSFALAEGIRSGVLRPLNEPNTGPSGP